MFKIYKDSILYMSLFLLTMVSTPIYAQQNNQCPNGVKACHGLIDNEGKYNKCMSIICDAAQKARKIDTTPIKECDIGYRKCNVLRDDPMQYWTCVDETCLNPPPNANPSCKHGHKQCRPKLRQYWTCMSDTCQIDYDDFKTCKMGETQCASSNTEFWNCVTEECLGSVDKYRNPNYYAKQIKNKTLKYLNLTKMPPTPAKYIAPPLRGVSRKYKYAPSGVNGHDWSSTIPAPIRTLNKGTAIAQLVCSNPQASISCQSTDISSCSCSDGSRPKSRSYIKDFREERIKKIRDAEIKRLKELRTRHERSKDAY